MSIGNFDIFAKIRNLLNFGHNLLNFGFRTREKSLKRKNDDQPECSNLTKYRRVTSEFPTVISKSLEDDSHFIQPRYTDSAAKAQKNVEMKCSVSGYRRKLFNSNIPNFAELEFSDDEEDIYSRACRRAYQAPRSSFNTRGFEFRKPLPSQENTKPREINSRYAGILNPEYKTNGFVDHTSSVKNYASSVSLVSDTQVKNSKRPSSVMSKVFNLEEDGCINLLVTRRSMHISDRRNFITDRINLASIRTKKKVERFTGLDDDVNKNQPPKEVIDDDNIEIISACQQLDNKTCIEPPPKTEIQAVEPIKTLKDKLDLTPILQPNWFNNFRERNEKQVRLRKQQIKGEEEDVWKLGKEAEKLKTFFEKQLKNVIDTATIVLEDSEPEEEEVEFPDLTEEEIAFVKKAIYKGPGDEVLINKFNLQITRRDVNTLVGNRWLNDEVINFYMNLLSERGEQRLSEGLPRVYAMNTFFIPRLMQSGYSGVRRWTRKVNLFSYDIIPVPVHIGRVHWCMAIINLKDRSIKYYDSMGTPNPRILQVLERYLQEEYMDKKGYPFNTSDFVKESVLDVPKQMNGHDCGVFSCMFAEYITRNKAITFSQQHIPYFRMKMILEIVQGKLLL